MDRIGEVEAVAFVRRAMLDRHDRGKREQPGLCLGFLLQDMVEGQHQALLRLAHNPGWRLQAVKQVLQEQRRRWYVHSLRF